MPLAINLLCSLIRSDKQTPEQCLNEFLNSSGSILNRLDNLSYSSDLRIKLLFESSFNRLCLKEREAFVSLSVFDSADFDIDAAVYVVSGDRFQAKKTLRNLEKRLQSITTPKTRCTHFTLCFSLSQLRKETKS